MCPSNVFWQNSCKGRLVYMYIMHLSPNVPAGGYRTGTASSFIKCSPRLVPGDGSLYNSKKSLQPSHNPWRKGRGNLIIISLFLPYGKSVNPVIGTLYCWLASKFRLSLRKGALTRVKDNYIEVGNSRFDTKYIRYHNLL